MSIFKLKQRKLILFDLDGTLVDTAADMHLAMNLALQQLNWGVVSEEQVRKWVGQGTAKLCDAVLQFLFHRIDTKQHRQLLALYLDLYSKHLCVHSRTYVGVLEFLDFCKAQHITLACVTNKPEGLAKELLTHLGLMRYFELVVGGDTLPVRKPDPAPLIHSMQLFHATKPQTLMIGDSRNDIEAARAAGIDCIVMSYGYNHGERIEDSQPQQIIDNLSQLIQ